MPRSSGVNTTSPEALEQQITQRAQHGALVNFTSSGRLYTFYWLRSGKRLAVKIHKRRPLPRLPNVEALARKLNAAWSCPECGVVFRRHGKQKFCSPAHAAKFRKKRWVRSQQRKKRGEALRAEALARGRN